MLSGEGVVDEKILLVVVHRVSFCESGKPISEIHRLDAPAAPLELLYHVIMKILVVDGIVLAKGGCIVIIDHRLDAVNQLMSVSSFHGESDYIMPLGHGVANTPLRRD